MENTFNFFLSSLLSHGILNLLFFFSFFSSGLSNLDVVFFFFFFASRWGTGILSLSYQRDSALIAIAIIAIKPTAHSAAEPTHLGNGHPPTIHRITRTNCILSYPHTSNLHLLTSAPMASKNVEKTRARLEKRYPACPTQPSPVQSETGGERAN